MKKMKRRIVEQYLRVRIYTKDLDTNKELMYFDGVYEGTQKIKQEMKAIKERFGNDLELRYDLYWENEREIHWEENQKNVKNPLTNH